MRIVVVTGMSGSGKTAALRALEDLGYYAIDNLPISLLDKLVELFSSATGEVERLALVVDARMLQGSLQPQQRIAAIPQALDATRAAGHQVDLVYLDTSDAILERRFSETRRRHPLSHDGSSQAGIRAERRLLEVLKSAATTALDTSQLSVHELKRAVQHAFGETTDSAETLSVTVMSFGFKHGAPNHADLVFDVRFLPNPYFVAELRQQTGNDAPVRDYVFAQPHTGEFLGHVQPLLEFLLPRYTEEGKVYLTVGIGCTGGRHRSVALANHLGDWVRELGFRVQVQHRDVGK